MIWSIAWKNIWRNKIRSLIVIFAVAIGIYGGAYSCAIMFGMSKQKIDSAIKNEVSHLQIHHKSFLENNDIKYFIPDAETISAKVSKISGVKAVSLRTKITGMIFSANASTGVQIVGIDPNSEKMVTGINHSVCDSCGKYFEGVKRNPVLLSRKMAEKLKVRLHSKIIIRFQGLDGNLVESAFKVVGIYQTKNGIFDEINIFVRQTDLAPIIGDGMAYHEIAVLLKDNDEVKNITANLKQQYPDLSIMSWSELAPDLQLLTATLNTMLYFLVGIILLALAFGIVNTMLMVVLERTRELGMLMSIGMNHGRIFRMIMLETILLSLTGGIIGLVLTVFTVLITAKTGINFESVSQGFEAVGYDSLVFPEISTEFLVIIMIMVVTTGILSSIYPARKALKLRPADAVRVD